MDPSKKNIYLIAGVALLILLAAIYFLFVYPSRSKNTKNDEVPTEVRSVSEIETTKRPYVTLTPTSNGAEIVMSMENMKEFDAIEYELTYLADNPQIPGEKIERGSVGSDVNTKEEKYKKSLLLGTASRGVSSPDRGIEKGRLTLHMLKGGIEYNSETKWTLFQVGTKAQKITDEDEKFSVSLPAFTKEYWVVLADTVGIPKNPEFDISKAALPTYGSFSIAPKFQKPVEITIASEASNPELYFYNNQDEKWNKLNSKYNEKTKAVSAQIDSFSTFVVVSQ